MSFQVSKVLMGETVICRLYIDKNHLGQKDLGWLHKAQIVLASQRLATQLVCEVCYVGDVVSIAFPSSLHIFDIHSGVSFTRWHQYQHAKGSLAVSLPTTARD